MPLESRNSSSREVDRERAHAAGDGLVDRLLEPLHLGDVELAGERQARRSAERARGDREQWHGREGRSGVGLAARRAVGAPTSACVHTTRAWGYGWPVETISIVEADPDLGELLDPGELERARREARARLQRLSPGEWDAAAALEHDAHHRGFLIVDGPAQPHRRRARPPLRRAARARRRDAPVAVGRRGLARPRGGRLDRARADAPRGARPRPRPADGAVPAARRRAVQPRHAPRAPPRGRARDRPPPARRRPAAADALAPRRALGPRPHRRRRRPAAAQPPAARRPRRRPPPVGHDRDGRARARRRRSAAARAASGCCTERRRRSCATTGWWPRSRRTTSEGPQVARPLRRWPSAQPSR